MNALAEEATCKLDGFDPQNIANLAWAWATLEYHPGDATMDAFAEEATRKLDGFDPQAIANLAWAWAVLAYHGPQTHPLWLEAETTHTNDRKAFNSKCKSQLYQYLLKCQHHQDGGAALPPLDNAFTASLEHAWERQKQEQKKSSFHSEVSPPADAHGLGSRE